MSGPEAQNWRPLGLVIEPPASSEWWNSHASYPTVVERDGGAVSVFFSVRDRANKSSLACVDVAIEGDCVRTISPVRGPLFGPGRRGAFDSDGVTVTSFVWHEGALLAFYLGWTVGVSVPFTNTIGVAVERADGTFERMSAAPIVGRSEINPFTLGYPWVLKRESGMTMWFGSHLHWGESGLEMEHVVRKAQSTNGIVWEPSGDVVIPLNSAQDPAEFAISRPVIIEECDGSMSMWYARRHPQYSLGYAYSSDQGHSWTRCDGALVIDGGRAPWEAVERTYPCVFDYQGHRYMLYNGDGYGGTGFGIAILENA